MRVLLFAAAAACVCLPMPVSADSRQIVVSPTPTKEWVAKASRRLDRALARVRVRGADTGISTVWFNATREGKPTNVRTVEQGPTGLDYVARTAVRRLRLPRLDGVPDDQLYEAIIIYAEGPVEFEKLRGSAVARAAEQRKRLAGNGLPSNVISLGAIAAF